MKFISISTFLTLPSLAIGFLPSRTPTIHSNYNTASFATNVLEGKEIKNEFTPINNMLLVRKGEVVDQTEGGIFLTGKVRFHT